MWILEIKQTVPRYGYTLEEKVTFKSRNFNKLVTVIQNLESSIDTEFILKREEDNNGKQYQCEADENSDRN